MGQADGHGKTTRIPWTTTELQRLALHAVFKDALSLAARSWQSRYIAR